MSLFRNGNELLIYKVHTIFIIKLLSSETSEAMRKIKAIILGKTNTKKQPQLYVTNDEDVRFINKMNEY